MLRKSRLGVVLIKTYEGEDTESTEGGVSLGDGDGLLELLKSGVPGEL